MLSIGIVGLPNVGKSTLFKALTKKQIDIANYPFTTIEPNVGVVAVPDERLEPLAKISNSKKILPTAIEFIDIAGLVRGAAQGEGLGNKFLANIREVDAIVQIIRVFDDTNITHVHNRIDPFEDIEIINTELILADLETVTKRLEKSKKDRKAIEEVGFLTKLHATLSAGKLANEVVPTEKEKIIAKELNLLTAKKIIYVFNISEKQLKESWQPNFMTHHGIIENWVRVSAPFELVLSEASPEEQKLYLAEVGLIESGLDSLIKKSYSVLDLITFLTTGEDETRAWTAKAGSLAPQAVRAIHTDFERLFIRAEVINWRELLTIGGWAAARSQGKLKIVGKDYEIRDGDVVEVRI